MENNKEGPNNKETSNDQKSNSNDNMLKINEIDKKFKFFDDTKDNYDKLFIHENIENIHLIENNLDIIDKKMNYLKLNKELYNTKKPDINSKLQLKRQTRNIIIEELTINNNNENKDSYFNIDPEAFNYSNNNKNLLYKSEGLENIFN